MVSDPLNCVNKFVMKKRSLTPTQRVSSLKQHYETIKSTDTPLKIVENHKFTLQLDEVKDAYKSLDTCIYSEDMTSKQKI